MKLLKLFIQTLTLLGLLICVSCKESTKSKSEPQKSDNLIAETEAIKEEERLEQRTKELELLKEYQKLRYEDITDENGFVLEFSIDPQYGETKELGISDKVIFERNGSGGFKGEDGFSYQLKLSLKEKIYHLKVNGELRNKVRTVEQVYTVVYSTRNEEEILTFEPEIQDVKKRASVFENIDDFWYKFWLPQTDATKTQWRKTYQNWIKESGILNINTYQDFLDYKVKNNYKNELSIDLGEVEVNRGTIIENDTYQYLKITVDNLRVRRSPDLDSDKIENLAFGSTVEFLEKSNNQTSVTIKDEEITEYWYKVRTASGKIGWIHGCCFEK